MTDCKHIDERLYVVRISTDGPLDGHLVELLDGPDGATHWLHDGDQKGMMDFTPINEPRPEGGDHCRIHPPETDLATLRQPEPIIEEEFRGHPLHGNIGLIDASQVLMMELCAAVDGSDLGYGQVTITYAKGEIPLLEFDDQGPCSQEAGGEA